MTLPRFCLPIYSYLLHVGISVILCFFLFTPIRAAQDGLWLPSDTLSTDLVGWRATHSVSFTLPSNSFPIRNIDYIRIHMAAFSDLTPATLVSGEFSGIPVFSVSGNNALITGITVQPGARITIDGITAINPATLDEYQVVIIVTEDAAGTKGKNAANVIATRNYANVMVTATLPNELSNLRLSGFTSPETFIVFSEANAVIGTDVANSIGGFTHLFTGLQPTTHRLTVYGIDRNNRTTSPYPLQIYTAASQETSVSNVLLSPTLQLNTARFIPGDPIIASGSALPDGLITIFVDAPLRTYYTNASSSGEWTYTIDNSSDFVYGDYRIYALTQTESGLQSLVSNSQNFSLVAATSPTGEACGDIGTGDLNCDGSVDLTDFSILMYYWGTADAAADINTDGLVNLVDFSILMYWWGN